MNLATPVEKLFMVGPTYARRLGKINIRTAEDLLYHFPYRYEDYSFISPIRNLRPSEVVTIRGKVIQAKNVYTKFGKKIQELIVSDLSGQTKAIWFNQPFLIRNFKPGLIINLSGKVGWFDRKISLVSPEYEIINRTGEPFDSAQGKQGSWRAKGIHTGRLVPIYHETYGISSKWLRSRIAPLIEQLADTTTDFLPLDIKKKHQLIDWPEAIKEIHFPQNTLNAQNARTRFAFEEMLLIHLNTLIRKRNWQKKRLAFPLNIDGEKILEFLENLPFELTKAQKRVLREIFSDLKKKQPMNRLLEGEVGSGKTIVAAAAIYAAFLSQTQSALMAPTEILAYQHFNTLNQILTPLGMKIDLLTGSQKPKTKDQRPKANLIIGTHALIYKWAQFEKLGLAIIDEQHRFGVEQRSQLIKKGRAPHILTMTATPIPRTIALTAYGDLDLSVIDQMPPGRQAVKTWVVPSNKRQAAYQWIKKQVKDTSHQAFIICPLIEESLAETMASVKAANVEFKRLQKEIFADLRLGLLHGRLKSKEKNEVIDKFKKNKIDILVSTPVVEVGIDVSTATVIMIEAAERFGLAQLHQLRGRVGRGGAQSYCLLFTELHGQKIFNRLKALERTNIGMELAEIDLKLRGPGEIYGTAQHGFFDLKIASFSDVALIEKTKKTAQEIIAKNPQLNQYPLLKAKIKQDTIKSIEPN